MAIVIVPRPSVLSVDRTPLGTKRGRPCWGGGQLGSSCLIALPWEPMLMDHGISALLRSGLVTLIIWGCSTRSRCRLP
jgi:hypothetical protein